MKELFLAIAISHGADVGSSVYAFKGGALEANPLVPSTKTAPFALSAAAVTVGELSLLHHWEKKHPKVVRTLAFIDIGVRSYITIHNIRIGRNERAK